jgi:hypothetical protein
LSKAVAESFIRLVTKETAETKSRLLHNLANLNVWGVETISLTQDADDVKVTEDTDQIIFHDADISKLEIYLSIKDSPQAMVEFELSKEFIRYCGIINPNFQNLVFPILQYPLEGIEKLLEEYELDGLDDYDKQSTEFAESVSEEGNGRSFPIPESILAQYPCQGHRALV